MLRPESRGDPISLAEFHRRCGGTLEPSLGVEVVRAFGDAEAEYSNILSSSGLLDLTFLRAVRIHGADAADYLHRSLSNSVRSLEVGEGCHAALLQPEGKMIAELTLHRRPETEFLAITPALCTEEFITSLQKYIFSEDCTVERVGGALLGVVGPRAGAVVERVTGVSARDLTQWGIAPTQGGGAVMRLRLTAHPGFAVLASSGDLEALWVGLAEAEAQPTGMEALHVHRIEAGIPMFGVDHDSQWMPADAGIESLVDFDKGCFPGQEAVAKVHNIGHPRHVLRGFEISGDVPPPPGTEVFRDEEAIGSLSSVCTSPALGKPIGLGHVKWKWREARDGLRLGRGGEHGEAEVHELPFVEPAGSTSTEARVHGGDLAGRERPRP
jgi:folate-binding protein YgfZ